MMKQCAIHYQPIDRRSCPWCQIEEMNEELEKWKNGSKAQADRIEELAAELCHLEHQNILLKIQVVDRGESYAMAQSEIATLQSLVPVLNGECDICSCVPATQYTLCDEHWDKAKESPCTFCLPPRKMLNDRIAELEAKVLELSQWNTTEAE